MQIVEKKSKNSPLQRHFIAVAALSLLCACSTVKEVQKTPTGSMADIDNNVVYAAAAPLRDLNIGTPEIPTQLKDLQNPYGVDTLTSCEALLAEAQSLDSSLARAENSKVGKLHRNDTRAGKLGNTADSATKALATSVVPFRGVVRLASGAAKKEKKLNLADKAGRERIGFLIGVGSANRCPGFNVAVPTLR